MNLFTGMTDHEIISALLMFALFNLYVMLLAAALVAFYVSSKPRRGRVRTAALWHMGAAVVFLFCLITTVWAAPAQKSFIDADLAETFFKGERFQKVVIGLVAAVVGVGMIIVGLVRGSRQRREAAQEALLAV
ncbi:MAG TPA: hypothetical protein VI316_01645 [Candidatus Dormibacteraeota bacterium]